MSKDIVEVIGIKDYQNVKPMMHSRIMPNNRVLFAKELILRFGTLPGAPALGETVQKACDMAQIAYDEFEKRGWLSDVPSWDDLQEGK